MTSSAEPRAPQQPDRDAAQLLRSGLVVYTLLLVLSIGWAGCEGRSLAFASPEAAREGVHWLRDMALGLAVGVALVAASRGLTRRSEAGRALADALRDLLGNPGLGTCLLLAAISGLAEEAFFRGVLQPDVGIVAASTLFALAHFVPRRAWLVWPLFAFAAGLVFGGLFVWTHNLVAPVLAHFSVNALNLHWLASGAGVAPSSDTGSGSAR